MVDVASAIDRARAGEAAWAASQRRHELAPPDEDFADRLRQTAKAASLEASALEYAITAGLTRKDPWTSAPQFPYELSAAANRPGDPKLWEHWDEAANDWREAALGTSIAALAAAFRFLAAWADALAESVDEERGVTGRDARGTGSVRPA